jgi:hypothetical protein
VSKAPSIRVTAEILEALDEVKSAVKALPAGESRKKGLAGLRVLEKALRGATKPLAKVTSCPRYLPNI